MFRLPGQPYLRSLDRFHCWSACQPRASMLKGYHEIIRGEEPVSSPTDRNTKQRQYPVCGFDSYPAAVYAAMLSQSTTLPPPPPANMAPARFYFFPEVQRLNQRNQPLC